MASITRHAERVIIRAEEVADLELLFESLDHLRHGSRGRKRRQIRMLTTHMLETVKKRQIDETYPVQEIEDDDATLVLEAIAVYARDALKEPELTSWENRSVARGLGLLERAESLGCDVQNVPLVL